jgi:hypothetical protein
MYVQWWRFWKKQAYPMPSCFTNQRYRQSFAGKILIFKAVQMFLLFLSSIIFQMLWYVFEKIKTTICKYEIFIVKHYDTDSD